MRADSLLTALRPPARPPRAEPTWLTPSGLETLAAQARARQAEGKTLLPYDREQATAGLDALEGGRTFGVELEFGLPKGAPPAALRRVGEDLFEAGLTRSAEQQQAYAGLPCSTRHDGGWRFEEEGSSKIAGEVISPIMRDTPRTWEALEHVVDTLRAQGGEATTAVGGHVHVGIPDFGEDVRFHAALIELLQAFEGELFRLAASPERGTHRGTTWCYPNLMPAEGYQSLSDLRDVQSKGFALFFPSEGGPESHVEFRLWDASLEPSVVQLHIKLSLALTEWAKRRVLEGAPPLVLPDDPAQRLQVLLDGCFTREDDKRRAATLYALNEPLEALPSSVPSPYVPPSLQARLAPDSHAARTTTPDPPHAPVLRLLRALRRNASGPGAGTGA